MTREEAKERFLSLHPTDRFIVVEEIYNDFEGRVCENCEYHHNYHEDTASIDGCNDSYCNRIGINTPSYFGCNKFKRRTK